MVDARDARVAHAGQRLALGLEASDDLPRVHALADDLEGHLATDGPPPAPARYTVPMPPEPRVSTMR